jgi:hypothetical protein
MFCLGTLLKYREQRNHRFSFIYLTNGDKGISDDPKSDHAETARVRAAEAAKVAKEFAGSLDIIPNADEALYDSWTNPPSQDRCYLHPLHERIQPGPQYHLPNRVSGRADGESGFDPNPKPSIEKRPRDFLHEPRRRLRFRRDSFCGNTCAPREGADTNHGPPQITDGRRAAHARRRLSAEYSGTIKARGGPSRGAVRGGVPSLFGGPSNAIGETVAVTGCA